VVATNGTARIYLPDGAYGFISNGTDGEVDGGYIELEGGVRAAGWTEVEVTVSGDLLVWVGIEYEEIGDVVGIVGAGTRPSVQLVGPRFMTAVNATVATFVETNMLSGEDFYRVYAPGAVYTVDGAGAFEVTMPVGCYGTVTGSGGLLIGGHEEVTLNTGLNELTTNATTGNLHVNVSNSRMYMLNGRVSARSGTATALRGRFEGTMIIASSPLNTISIQSGMNARAIDWWDESEYWF
jgi:hypothetical protein